MLSECPGMNTKINILIQKQKRTLTKKFESPHKGVVWRILLNPKNLYLWLYLNGFWFCVFMLISSERPKSRVLLHKHCQNSNICRQKRSHALLANSTTLTGITDSCEIFWLFVLSIWNITALIEICFDASNYY